MGPVGSGESRGWWGGFCLSVVWESIEVGPQPKISSWAIFASCWGPSLWLLLETGPP